ncbi:uncharacterized protein LOC134528804 [Bacillus rossius redtenbacheri]|uniref:uncharacterized protein LOC134528804 n=1 Tax=Bacillus rossius redtenbacheri TaxID=93214 RepID=UPI002FDCE73B
MKTMSFENGKDMKIHDREDSPGAIVGIKWELDPYRQNIPEITQPMKTMTFEDVEDMKIHDKPMEIPGDFSSETTNTSGGSIPSSGTGSGTSAAKVKEEKELQDQHSTCEKILCNKEDSPDAIVGIKWELDPYRQNIPEIPEPMKTMSFENGEDIDKHEEDSKLQGNE